MQKEFDEYPEEFDSKRFLDFIRERFGSPIMPEEELLIRFTRFIQPRQKENKKTSDEDIQMWYESLVKEFNSMERPLDAAGTDISDPLGHRRPTLEKRVQDQDREVSLATGLLKEKHRKEEATPPESMARKAPGRDKKKRPKGPQMGDGN